MYGFGCFVAPFVATAIASRQDKWMLFYLFPMGLSAMNLGFVLFAFYDQLGVIRSPGGDGEEGVGEQQLSRNKMAMEEIKQMLKLRELWNISLFFFLYLGTGITAGGKMSYLSSKVIKARCIFLTSGYRLGSSIPRQCSSGKPCNYVRIILLFS
jgi:fucose permease